MKLFYKKFLTQKNVSQVSYIPTHVKTKTQYVLQQILIWGFILAILFFILEFLVLNFSN